MAHLRHHPQHASALGRIRSMALRTLRLRRPDRGRISGRHLHPGMGRRDPPRLSESLRIAKPGRTLLRRPIARLPRRAGQLRPRHRRRPAPPRTRSVPLGRASPIRPRHRSAPPADSLNGLRAGRPPRSNIGRQLGGHPGRVAGYRFNHVRPIGRQRSRFGTAPLFPSPPARREKPRPPFPSSPAPRGEMPKAEGGSPSKASESSTSAGKQPAP